MPALLIAFVVVAGIQPGLAGGQDRDSSQDELEGLNEALAALPIGSEAVERVKRFQLYTGCSPLWVLAFVAGDDAKTMGLTRDRLQAAAESRLRAARLYTEHRFGRIDEFLSSLLAGEPDPKIPKSPPYLSVATEVDGDAFLVQVHLQKTLSDPASGEESQATTWGSGRYGTHAGRAGHIVQLVAEELDRFLVEYLRVNEKDCPR